jgi:hypothetical protein
MTDPDQAIIPKAAERAARAPASSLSPIIDPTASATSADPTAPTPDIGRTFAASEAPRARSIEATILTALAMLYSLYLAREFLIPIAFAFWLATSSSTRSTTSTTIWNSSRRPSNATAGTSTSR